jgi:hypothetical protein
MVLRTKKLPFAYFIPALINAQILSYVKLLTLNVSEAVGTPGLSMFHKREYVAGSSRVVSASCTLSTDTFARAQGYVIYELEK